MVGIMSVGQAVFRKATLAPFITMDRGCSDSEGDERELFGQGSSDEEPKSKKRKAAEPSDRPEDVRRDVYETSADVHGRCRQDKANLLTTDNVKLSVQLSPASHSCTLHEHPSYAASSPTNPSYDPHSSPTKITETGQTSATIFVQISPTNATKISNNIRQQTTCSTPSQGNTSMNNIGTSSRSEYTNSTDEPEISAHSKQTTHSSYGQALEECSCTNPQILSIDYSNHNLSSPSLLAENTTDPRSRLNLYPSTSTDSESSPVHRTAITPPYDRRPSLNPIKIARVAPYSANPDFQPGDPPNSSPSQENSFASPQSEHTFYIAGSPTYLSCSSSTSSETATYNINSQNHREQTTDHTHSPTPHARSFTNNISTPPRTRSTSSTNSPNEPPHSPYHSQQTTDSSTCQNSQSSPSVNLPNHNTPNSPNHNPNQSVSPNKIAIVPPYSPTRNTQRHPLITPNYTQTPTVHNFSSSSTSSDFSLSSYESELNERPFTPHCSLDPSTIPDYIFDSPPRPRPESIHIDDSPPPELVPIEESPPREQPLPPNQTPLTSTPLRPSFVTPIRINSLSSTPESPNNGEGTQQESATDRPLSPLSIIISFANSSGFLSRRN